MFISSFSFVISELVKGISFQMNAVSILLGLIVCVVATATASDNKFGMPTQPGSVKEETFDFGAPKTDEFAGYQNFEDPYTQSGEQIKIHRSK